MRFRLSFLLLVSVLLFGCSSSPRIPDLVVQEEDTMIHLEPGLRPDNFLFPEYFFMEDFELDQHGRIPDTPLIGIDLRSELPLKEALRRFNKMLMSNGWTINQVEIKPDYFLLKAIIGAETLEVRAVQGSGPTQVFVLYKP